MAQLGAPDMRVPIAHCLAYPERIDTPVQRLDLAKLGAGLAAWPEQTPDGAERQLLELALPRAVATARFVRWVERDNG